eukprot:80632-Chlamydomonas_euryale.AAC.1
MGMKDRRGTCSTPVRPCGVDSAFFFFDATIATWTCTLMRVPLGDSAWHRGPFERLCMGCGSLWATLHDLGGVVCDSAWESPRAGRRCRKYNLCASNGLMG